MVIMRDINYEFLCKHIRTINKDKLHIIAKNCQINRITKRIHPLKGIKYKDSIKLDLTMIQFLNFR